jgi:hypothetical protein
MNRRSLTSKAPSLKHGRGVSGASPGAVHPEIGAPLSKYLELVFGALAPTLAEQLTEQGLKFDHDKIGRLDRNARGITYCVIDGVMTDSEAKRCRQRIIRRVAALVETKK